MNPLQRHVAGATVAHTSPFAALQIPVSYQMLSATIRDTWVVPLYHGLSQPPVKTFITSHRHHINDVLITQLLTHFDWRSRTAAAYLAAVANRSNLTPHMGRLLLRSDVCYAGEAYCIALAAFNSTESIAFLNEYLGYYLTRTDFYFDQGSAMAALSYLDRLNGTSMVVQHLDAWNQFVLEKPHWNLNDSIVHFNKIMHTLHTLT